MSKSAKPTFQTRFDISTRELARIMNERTGGGAFANYFVTLTFDRYHDRYLIVPSGNEMVNRVEVKSGLTRAMPPSAAIDVRMVLIRRFYVRLCNLLLGRNFARLRNFQPTGIGWLDAPVKKNARTHGPFAKTPGDVFEHAHIVMAIPTHVLPGRSSSIQEWFEEQFALGHIEQIWRRLQPNGEAQIKPVWDVYGALDYSAKTAKRYDAYNDYLITLPA